MGKIQKILSLLIAALAIPALFSCGGETRKEGDQHKRNALMIQTDQPFNLKIGQIAWIESDNLFIEFIEITEDSRCPVGVICAWEGQVTALLGPFKGDDTHAEYSVTSREGHPDLAVASFDDYVITLTKLSPDKIAGETIELTDYEIELLISRKE